MKHLIAYIILASTSLTFFWLWQTKETAIVGKEIVYDSTVYIDTVKQIVQKPDSVVYKWKIIKGAPDTFFASVDTPAIIKDYLSEVYGSHILKDDSMAFVSFDYTLQGNRLREIRGVTYQNRQPISIINVTENKERNHFLIGGGLLVSNKADISLNLSYQSKKWQYTGGYFMRNKAVYLGVSYQIK